VLKNQPSGGYGAFLLSSFFSNAGNNRETLCHGVCLLPWRLHSSPGQKKSSMVNFCDLGSRSVRFRHDPSTRLLGGTQLILCSPAYLSPGEVF
jgi:hypothetical protein